MNCPSLVAKTSAIEWTLWKNAWQRYLKKTGLGGHAAFTQLWECLSSETGVGLCNAGFGEEDNIDRLIEEIRKSVIGNLNKLSQRVEQLNMGQHDRETVREHAARLPGKTDWCGLAVTCSRADCDTKNSYANDIILTRLLRGLKTREFREKVLQKGDDINLDDTLVLLELLECGRSDNTKLEKAHGGSVAAAGTARGARPKGGS